MVVFDDKAGDAQLDELRLREQEDLAQLIANQNGLQYADITRTQIDNEALALIPESDARAHSLAAFNMAGRTVSIATTNPQTAYLSDFIEKMKRKNLDVAVFLVSKISLEKAWQAYKEISQTKKTVTGVVDISEKNIQSILDSVVTIAEGKELLSQTIALKDSNRITRLIEAILGSAMALRASDIHFEPESEHVGIRYRVDGILSAISDISPKDYHFVLARIKLLSGLKINIGNIPQDGRFSIRMGAKEIEMRVSSLPGENGESLVMRILDPDALKVEIEALGMHPKMLDTIKHVIKRPNGMILNTGPTGSGKTTTLYSFLLNVKSPETKVITVEDPIEYHLEGIVQTQTSKDGLTFSDGLRSILRQDPDVIMVGEIRDAETAQIALRASLTGHMVYSTLHTNTAAGAFARLIDLRINPKIIGSAVTAVMAQRLVRILREDCRIEVPIEGYVRERIDFHLDEIMDQSLIGQRDVMYLPDHEKAKELGYLSAYYGRIGIFDIVMMTPELDDLLQKGSPGEREVKKVAKLSGMLTMEQDAALKILSGVTSFEEIERVIIM